MRHNILNLFGDHFTLEARDILGALGSVEYSVMTQAELAEVIDAYDVVFMGLYPELDRAILTKAGHLKVITTATTNLDHIDLAYAKGKGIAVLSLKDETEFLNTITGTAEIALGLMIDLMRRTPWAFDDVKSYHWRRERFRGSNLYAKTLGIVGLGRLGTMMARYANTFNMQVIAYSPHSDVADFGNAKCRPVDFPTLLTESDVISLHVPLTEQTKHMFNNKAFAGMKRRPYLINTAVREIVHEGDVLAALEKQQLAGYGTDVLADELWFDEGFTNHPLVEYAKKNENLIILPHIGGMTHESRAATDVFMANALKAFLSASA